MRPSLHWLLLLGLIGILAAAACSRGPGEERSLPSPGGPPAAPGVPALGPNVARDASRGDDVYRPHSNVDDQAKVAVDVADILQLARQPDLPVAEMRAIYESGKNVRGASLRRLASDQEMAATFAAEAGFFGTPAFLDLAIMDAFNGTGAAASYSAAQRREALAAGLQRLVAHTIIHQLQIAEDKLRKGDPDSTDRSHNYIDRAWAYYVATAEGPRHAGSLAAAAVELEQVFGREGTIDQPLREAFARMQDGAGRRNLDVFLPARADAEQRLHTIFYLMTARQLAEASRAADRGDPGAAAAQQARGLAAYAMLQPAIAAADAGADRVLTTFFQTVPDQLSAAQGDDALTALNRAAPALNFKTADLVGLSDYRAG